MIKVVVTLAKNALALLITVASASATDDAIKKICGWGIVKAGKGKVISNEDMGDSICIIKSLKNSSKLLARISETAEHKKKKIKKTYLLVCR